MPKINILPSKVYNRIAAGEVIERPFSVVKELVENSLDAGATQIEIYVEKGGKQLIKVVDNGYGIAREDLHSAFLPHATSKIATAEDLDGVITLGFRGEAIASIASISDMSITSKVDGGKRYRLNSFGGDLGQIEEVAGEEVGTEVTVESLFLNTPVRFKFLKTDKGEETEITNIVSRFILNRYDVSFTYYADGKKILQSYGEGLKDALVSVYGATTLRDCFQIDAQKHGVRVYGYIGNHNFFKANKTYQSTFLNGRYIINGTISSAITNAYGSYMMKRQYPFYVLHIEVPREIVDVNVHPNKADVRFSDNQIIYGCIYTIISSILDGSTKALDYIVEDENTAKTVQEPIPTDLPLAPPVVKEEKGATPLLQDKTFGFASFSYDEARREMAKHAPQVSTSKMALPFEVEGKKEEEKSEDLENIKGFFPMSKIGKYVPGEPRPQTAEELRGQKRLHELFPDIYSRQNSVDIKEQAPIDYFLENKKYLEKLDAGRAMQNRIDITSCRFVGKLFNTYILYEKSEDLYIIDQHAAHERLIFDRLKEKMKNREILRQPMLVPFEISLNTYEGDFIRERADDIEEMGFVMQDCGDNTFKVSEVPLDLQNINLTVFFNDILGHVKEYRAIKLEDLLKDKLASSACKAAVRAGRDLTQDEVEKLFAMMDGDMGLKCPHGRPVVVKISRKQIEKMFKRIV